MSEPETVLRVRRRNWLKVLPTVVSPTPPTLCTTVTHAPVAFDDRACPEAVDTLVAKPTRPPGHWARNRALNCALVLAAIFLAGLFTRLLPYFEVAVEAGPDTGSETTADAFDARAPRRPVSWPDIRFGGTMADEGRSSAVLNGFVVSAGEKYRGITVAEVRPNEVVLALRGESRVLYLGQSTTD